MTSSFHAIFTTAAAIDHEVERLRAQARLGWPTERAWLAAAGFRDGQRVIEIGSGPGAFRDRLLSDFPRLCYTAIDHDPRLLDRARRDCTPATSGALLHICASASALPLAGGRYDFALARLVFQHLKDPAGAAAELHRALVPGGTLAVIDSDDAMPTIFDPPIPALAGIALKVRLAQALRGGNRLIGRRLPRILGEGGFHDVSFDAMLLSSDTIGLEPFRQAYEPRFLRPLVESGLLTESELDAARRGLEAFFATPGALIVEHRLIACGTKPLAGH